MALSARRGTEPSIKPAGVTLKNRDMLQVTSVDANVGTKVEANASFMLLITTVNRVVASGALNRVEKNVVTLSTAVAWWMQLSRRSSPFMP